MLNKFGVAMFSTNTLLRKNIFEHYSKLWLYNILWIDFWFTASLGCTMYFQNKIIIIILELIYIIYSQYW